MNQPSEYAFFDVDDTVISIKSMHSFEEYYHTHKKNISESEKEKQWQAVVNRYLTWYEEGKSREFMNRKYFESFKGREVTELCNLAEDWWKSQLENNHKLFIPSTKNALDWHKKSNHGIVFVSGSFEELITLIAKTLEVNYFLCTKLERNYGTFSGKIINHQMVGQGKADAIMGFLLKEDVNPKNCYSYADDISDLPMLETVGNPVVVKGNPEMESIAKQKNWDLIEGKS